MDQERLDDLQFTTLYSHYAQGMQATLTGRIDRFASFLLIFLGSAVFSSSGASNKIIGILVSLLGAFQFCYQFSKASDYALIQSNKWLALHRRIKEDNLDEIESKIIDLEIGDVKEFACLKSAAMIRTRRALGWGEDNSIKLSNFDKIMSWLAGDLPKTRDENDSEQLQKQNH